MYNYYDGVIIFTVPNRNKTTVDKCDMNPHYVLCPVDKLNLVLYYLDDGGGGSTLLQHWVAFTKILLKKSKKRGFMEAKIKSISKIYTKLNNAYMYHIRVFY